MRWSGLRCRAMTLETGRTGDDESLLKQGSGIEDTEEVYILDTHI